MNIQKADGMRIAGTQKGATDALRKTGKALSKILEKLATARRINRASDDAAGLAIAEQLKTQVRGFKVANQNVSDAMSALNIADGASTEIGEMLQRQRELALQARNDTLTDDQRQQLDVEYQNLAQEIERIAQGTQFNTQNVASGQGLGSGAARIQVGPNAGDTVTLPNIDMTAASLAIAGISIADSASAAGALSAIDGAINTLGTQRSSVGAMVNRLESTQNNLMVAEVNTTAAESILRDQDMAMGLAELTRSRLLQETGIRAFQRFNDISANHILGLIRG
jgi:flagellin